KDEFRRLKEFSPKVEELLEGPRKERDLKKALSRVARLLDLHRATSDFPLFGEEDDNPAATGWEKLAGACRRLEVLAHKQLRRVRFSAEDNEFFTGYGATLAGIMLYGGNSYLTPRDDAPRVVDVYSNPGEGKHLLVGITRPRALWLLYPVGGVDV